MEVSGRMCRCAKGDHLSFYGQVFFFFTSLPQLSTLFLSLSLFPFLFPSLISSTISAVLNASETGCSICDTHLSRRRDPICEERTGKLESEKKNTMLIFCTFIPSKFYAERATRKSQAMRNSARKGSLLYHPSPYFAWFEVPNQPAENVLGDIFLRFSKCWSENITRWSLNRVFNLHPLAKMDF